MNFHVVTLFPEVLESAARGFGVVGQAIARGEIGLICVNPRAFTSNVHHTIDDRPFGGGDGMIMMAEPLAQALAQIRAGIDARAATSDVAGRVPAPELAREPSEDSAHKTGQNTHQKTDQKSTRVIHLSPRGSTFTDQKARELARYTDVILVASRYGGADQRFLNREVDEEISIGDYILTGGELAALVLVDAVGRLQPGVLGNEASSTNESFNGTNGLLEHPQFTRPREWAGAGVPDAYLSGDHAKIGLFQEALSMALTALRRPDLLRRAEFSVKKMTQIAKVLEALTDADYEICGLAKPGTASESRERVRTELAKLAVPRD